MNSHEQDLRRALAARSGEPGPEFQARLSAALATSPPRAFAPPAAAVAAAVLLVAASAGGLLVARHLQASPAGRKHPVVIAPTPTPTSSPSPVASTTPPFYPTNVDVSAGGGALWAYLPDFNLLYRSTDGGATWQPRPAPANLELPPSTSFISPQDGWLLTTGSPATQCQAESVAAIDHTTDAGATWTAIHPTGIADRQCKQNLSFVDSSRGFLAAADPNSAPVVYRTLDGGHTWAASRPLSDPPGFHSGTGGFELTAGRVHAFGSTLLVGVSGQSTDGTAHAYVFRSRDGGASWSYLAGLPQGTLPGFASATRWLLLMPSPMETTDAGASWHPFTSDYAQAAPVGPEVLFDGTTAYAVITTRGEIQRSLDGGAHWTPVRSPGT